MSKIIISGSIAFQKDFEELTNTLTENGHQPLLQEIARRYNQPEVTDAVNALLALDPLDNHPTKIPTLPTFYQPSLWTRPLLKANAQSLPDSALLHLGEMLRFPQ
ncbi:MAG: hypothetical protein E6730_16400, partial [Enterococcus casseliflavus]|nr:hypothetical protein [Enterococcus casseliflavus]